MTGRDVGVILGVLGALISPIVLALLFPEIAHMVTAVGQVIIAVGGAIVVIGVVTWAFVEEPDWSVRDAIRFVTALILSAALVGAFLLGLVYRRM
jgi:hypothetical protein